MKTSSEPKNDPFKVPLNEGITREIYIKLIIVSIICVIFMIGEVIGGMLSSSIALMTDAAHMLSDLVGFSISFLAVWLSRRPATEKLSYGFHRAEVIGGCTSILLIWGLTIWLIVEAGHRVVTPEVVNGEIMLITASGGLFANIIMGKVLHHHGHGHNHDHGHEHANHDEDKKQHNEHDGDHEHKHQDDDHEHQENHGNKENQHHDHELGNSDREEHHQDKHEEEDNHEHHHHHHEGHHHDSDHENHDDDEHQDGKEEKEQKDQCGEDKDKDDGCNENHGEDHPKDEHKHEHTHHKGCEHQKSNEENFKDGAIALEIDLEQRPPIQPFVSLNLNQLTYNNKLEILESNKNEASIKCTHSSSPHHHKSVHKNHQFKLLRLFTCSNVCKANGEDTEKYTCCPQSDKEIPVPIPSQNIIPQKNHSHSESHSHSYDNYNIRAAVLHVFGDFLQSIAVLIASIVIYFKPELSILDPILTFIFSLLVISTTIPMMREFTGILMEGNPKGLKVKELKEEMKTMDSVKEIHDFHVWALTSGKFALSAHIVAIDQNDALKEATLLCRKHGIFHSTIQVEDFKMKDSADWIKCLQDLH